MTSACRVFVFTAIFFLFSSFTIAYSQIAPRPQWSEFVSVEYTLKQGPYTYSYPQKSLPVRIGPNLVANAGQKAMQNSQNGDCQNPWSFTVAGAALMDDPVFVAFSSLLLPSNPIPDGTSIGFYDPNEDAVHVMLNSMVSLLEDRIGNLNYYSSSSQAQTAFHNSFCPSSCPNAVVEHRVRESYKEPIPDTAQNIFTQGLIWYQSVSGSCQN